MNVVAGGGNGLSIARPSVSLIPLADILMIVVR
jgi:hypothetical protein